MCKVADAAKHMINRSIELAQQERNQNYFVNFYKLHKLLYYAQGYMLVHNNTHLFEEEIEAHSCGPFIPKILDLSIGYNDILTKFDTIEICPITEDRIEAINHTLQKYGYWSKDELVNKSKQSTPYRQFFAEGRRNIIPRDAMARFKQEFDPSL